MRLIGLTGGIGSGKSTVAALLAQHGWQVVDADAIAREIVKPGQPALARLVEAFGEDILAVAGTLRRSVLAQRAFADAEHTQVLNSITHPAIEEETQWRFAAARAAGEPYVVYDMPLLVDKGLHTGMDAVIVVDVDKDTRIARLVDSRGLDEADARARIAAQVSDDVRLGAADYVIDNNGTLSQLAPQVAEVAGAIEKRWA
ncbi:MAG: dephospho-CoA kinase [Corynebacterium flavescens]|uniref:dephospho-CoA kinase n=1 Tax=Corynebacterium flavescens TaxID=28028 RepID=UPI003F906D4C